MKGKVVGGRLSYSTHATLEVVRMALKSGRA